MKRGARREPSDARWDAVDRHLTDLFRWSLRLSRLGTAIVVDNVVRRGAVLDERSDDPDVQGVRRVNELLAAEPAVVATTLQTVGSKGHDGHAIALVLRDS